MVDVMLFAVMFIVIGATFSIGFSWFMFNPYRMIALKRRMTGRNYGIIYFVTKGRALFPVVKDFNKDIIRTKKGIWFFRGGSIYRQTSEEHKDKLTKDVAEFELVKDQINKKETDDPEVEKIIMEMQKKRGDVFSKKQYYTAKVKLHHAFKPEEIEFRQGVPMVFLDIDDMMPMTLEHEFLSKEPKSRNPYEVEAVLGKEIAAAELEAMKMVKKNIQLLLIIVAVLVIIGAGISYMGYDNTNKIGAMVYNLTTRIP